MLNQFFFGYLSHAWKRLARSIACIFLFIHLLYFDSANDGRWLRTSMPGYENDFIIDYVFLVNEITWDMDNIFISFFYSIIPSFIYDISESYILEDFYWLFIEFSFSVIPTLIIIGFLSWIIKPFIVKEN